MAAATSPRIDTTSIVGSQPSAISSRSGRITGIDMARGIAMGLMVIVHFVAWREHDGVLSTAASLTSGRAMPLFMMLGGLGVTLMTARSTTPTRNLLLRAVMLMAPGLALTETIDRLAIVLQTYAVFFVLAIALHRLRSNVLLALVPLLAGFGGVSYQVFGEPAVSTSYDILFTSTEGLQSLFVDGYYPVFPVGAFFVFGMWLGRLELRSNRVARALLIGGVAVGTTVWIGANWVTTTLGLQTDFGGRAGDGSFHWSRLLDASGHSAMPAWSISALGTSAAILGFCLLVAPRANHLARPLTTVGSMSLTFYVFQAWMTNVVPNTRQTGIVLEWFFAIAVFVSFTLLATGWRHWFRSGPLERVVRLGSGPKQPPGSGH